MARDDDGYMEPAEEPGDYDNGELQPAVDWIKERGGTRQCAEDVLKMTGGTVRWQLVRQALKKAGAPAGVYSLINRDLFDLREEMKR